MPETLLGQLNSNGTVEGGIPIPGLASLLSDPATGKNTEVQGSNAFPSGSAPTIREVNVVHLAWDVMVGIGTCLLLLAVWCALAWLFRRDMPEDEVVPRMRVGRRHRGHRGARGRLGGHRGRTPAVDRARLHEGGGRRHRQPRGVDRPFLVVLALYLTVGVTTILVLRGMSRRFRESGRDDEAEVRYGPNRPPEADRPHEPVEVGAP